MGYITRVGGEFAISPPLTWNEFKDSPYSALYPAADDRLELFLRVNEECVDSDEGLLLRRTATHLVMSEIDGYRADDLLASVQRAVDFFPGHTFTGRLDCEGEENTDIWRVIVQDGRAVKVEPRIVWPDES